MVQLSRALIIGSAGILLATTGQPVPLAAVTSDSMAPTLSTGDLILAVPPSLVGGVSVGDIVLFHDGSGWVTHRIVDTTETGYLTAGDANPFLDQADGSPAVTESAIAGVVPTIGDRPVAVGGLGGYLDSSRRIVALLVGLGCLLVGLSSDRSRPVRPAHIGALAGVVPAVTWVGGRSLGAPGEAATYVNGNIVPVVVHADGRATLRWPGESIAIGDLAGTSVTHGWAPAWLLDTVGGAGEVAVVGCVVASTAVLAWGIAAVIWRLTGAVIR